MTGCTSAEIAGRLASATAPVWLVQSGTWPSQDGPISAPPSSATGLPICALGAVVGDGDPAQRWAQFQVETGGDYSRAADPATRLPPILSAYLEPPLVESLAERLCAGQKLPEAMREEAAGTSRRIVRFAPLDVRFDACQRVAQVVTSLQRGGAERIVLDLHRTLRERGVRSLLVPIGRPTREAFATPPDTIDVANRGGRDERVEAAAEVALGYAADLVHAHLLDQRDVARLSTRGLPVLLTVHNARPGWPQGLPNLQPDDAALLVACAKAVEEQLREVKIPVPVRTVWNGIEFGPFAQSPAATEAAKTLRLQLGIDEDDFVLVAVANPRPQKRLEMLPFVLAALCDEFRRRGIPRGVRLLIAGEPCGTNELALQSEIALRTAIRECGHEDRVHMLGAVADVPSLLAAADVLVSASAYEGLSLAHLEALAAGRPVVATAAGGTPEIAAGNPAMFLLPLDARPEQFAAVLADLAIAPPPNGQAAAEVHFARHRMAEGYARLYPRAIAAASRRKRDGLWLVINNFSTGGAQSSARRLLSGLAAQGVRVRAAVLEEQRSHPTPGRSALAASGIPVVALPPAGAVDPAVAVEELLEYIDADPPQAVLLWNVIPEYKLLLADALLDVSLHDVSPGEMYFTSLQRYFERPRPGLPYRTARDYGARLASAIVKYHGEAAKAAELLGAPVHVIPNGVPIRPRSAPYSGNRDGPLVLGTAARISPQKRLEDLFDALRLAGARMPPYVLRIAGGAERGAEDYAERLCSLAADLPVEWLGPLDDVSEFLQQLDLFAMISEPAGCPNASLEAMAVGLPVVATDVGGVSEQIVDGATGRIVPRGDAAALADALVELANRPDLRARYAAAAHARAAACFSVDRMIADYRRILLSA